MILKARILFIGKALDKMLDQFLEYWKYYDINNWNSAHDVGFLEVAFPCCALLQSCLRCAKFEGQIVKLSATPLKNRLYMVFYSNGTSKDKDSVHGSTVGCIYLGCLWGFSSSVNTSLKARLCSHWFHVFTAGT